jgi:Flp pilus assembly protein TadD
VSGLWRPLPLLSFWIEGRIGGWQPGLFHATGIALHAGCALALGLLLGQAGLSRPAVLLATFGFAALPAHVESVAWISGRPDLLCALFALVALWLDRRARAAGRRGPGGAALAAFAAALLSKEAAAGWALVILAAECVRGRSVPTPRREIARWVAPYVVVTLVWLAAHAAAAGEGALPSHVDQALRARRHAVGWTLLPQYLAFLWPWYPHASDVAVALPGRPLDATVLGGAAATLGAFGGAAWLAMRGSPLAVPAAMTLVPLVPAIAVALARGFVSSGERMMFLPSAGVAWLAAAGLVRLARGGAGVRWAAAAAGVVLALGGALETLRLQPSWRDDERVFRALTERQPGNPVGWVGLAQGLTARGARDEAERALSRAERLDPRLPSVALARAELHYRFGEWDRVLPHASRGLELDPRLFQARLLRASTLVRLGRSAEAAPDIDTLLHERPRDPSALAVAGQRHLAEGRPGEAVAPLAAAAHARPEDPALWAALGQARAMAGDLAGARVALEASVGLEPRAPRVLRQLATVCAALGDSVAAGVALERARAASGAPGP